MDILIFGAGAAGLMAAVTAAQQGAHVVVLEKTDRAGRKIALTGKGRCNLTNLKPWNDFQEHVHPNARYFKPAFFHFNSAQTVLFFNDLGLPTVVEHGDRVFPASYHAQDVTQTLQQALYRLGGQIVPYSRVVSLEMSAAGHIDHVLATDVQGRTTTWKADYYLLATGGMSYPLTGSSGDGYALAQRVGHTIEPVYPALTALMPQSYDRSLEGISLKNVALSLYTEGVCRRTEEGELSFTNLGIEGALAFRLSRQAVVALQKGQRVALHLNLKPAVPTPELRQRWEREQGRLRGFMPAPLVEPFEQYCQTKGVSGCEALQSWIFPILTYGGWERAVVTAGGVSMKEVDPKTMRSRLIDNLSFAGEILDLDADTGGYNLQIAFSTARLAAHALTESL